jgi:hypothetical protein
MMNKENINKTIEIELFSANENEVIAAIEKIGAQGNKFYIPLLFDLLLSKPGIEVEQEILKLLGTIKVKESVSAFIDALNDLKYKSIYKEILAACWQNGLEFHDYLPLFVKIVIEYEWETAFEAFTVVDNLEFLPDQKIVDQTRRMILGALNTIPENKEYFLREILAKID